MICESQREKQIPIYRGKKIINCSQLFMAWG